MKPFSNQWTSYRTRQLRLHPLQKRKLVKTAVHRTAKSSWKMWVPAAKIGIWRNLSTTSGLHLSRGTWDLRTRCWRQLWLGRELWTQLWTSNHHHLLKMVLNCTTSHPFSSCQLPSQCRYTQPQVCISFFCVPHFSFYSIRSRFMTTTTPVSSPPRQSMSGKCTPPP